MKFKHTLAVALAAGTMGGANAALVTSATPDMNDIVTFDEYVGDATTTHITSLNLTSTGGRSVGFASTPTASIGEVVSTIGGVTSPFFDLGGNGAWTLGKRFAATDNPGSLQFNFTAPVQSVGAFINYFVDALNPVGGFTISALGEAGTVLETHSLAFATPSGQYGYNEGYFYGIKHATADIKSFVVTDGYIAVDDLQFSAPVPEPSTVALMLLGLGVVGWSAMRRRLG